MVFVFQFVYIVDYVDEFLYIKPFLHPRDEAYLIMMDDCLMCSWIWLVRSLLRIFASVYIREFGLKYFIFVGSFCVLGIRVIVAS